MGPGMRLGHGDRGRMAANSFLKRNRSGFTIVELLIVIVVIGILAAITIVAYNGIQNRAKDTQTASALQSWIKGLKLYKAQNGQWPAGFTCLGEDYPYGETGTDTSGAQCRQDHAVASVNTAFHTTMRSHMNTLPMPALVTWSNGTNWYRGLSYLRGGGDGTQVYIMVTYAGTGQCPVVDGIASSASQAGGNILCNYLIGRTTDS